MLISGLKGLTKGTGFLRLLQANKPFMEILMDTPLSVGRALLTLFAPKMFRSSQDNSCGPYRFM